MIVCRDRGLGNPEGHDIVHRLAEGRQLHECHVACPPVVGGFQPQAGPAVVPGDRIAIVVEIVIMLYQPETTRVVIRKGVELQIGRVIERATDPFAVAAPQVQPVGIVHARADRIACGGLGRALEEHAGHRPDTQPLDSSPGIDMRIDIHDHALLGPRIDNELVGAGGTGRVEQGIDRQRGRVRGRTLEPECSEIRKFL